MTTHPSHTSEHEEAAALYALGVLEESALRVFEQHAAGCGRCAALLEADRELLVRLNAAAPEMDVSPAFKQRLLQRAAEELQSGAPVPLRSSADRSERRLRWRLPAWATAAALVLALGVGLALGQWLYAEQALASVPLQGEPGHGAATVVVRRSGAGELLLEGLPAPPTGRLYQAWIIGDDGLPVSAGVSPSGSGTVGLPGSVLGKTVAVTIEAAPGVPAPTDGPILVAVIGRP